MRVHQLWQESSASVLRVYWGQTTTRVLPLLLRQILFTLRPVKLSIPTVPAFHHPSFLQFCQIHMATKKMCKVYRYNTINWGLLRRKKTGKGSDSADSVATRLCSQPHRQQPRGHRKNCNKETGDPAEMTCQHRKDEFGSQLFPMVLSRSLRNIISAKESMPCKKKKTSKDYRKLW